MTTSVEKGLKALALFLLADIWLWLKATMLSKEPLLFLAS
jgi:hypothetical protein